MLFNLVGTQFVHNDQTYEIRKPHKEDLPLLANMINTAYAMWNHLGRGEQSQETIESFLMQDGLVVHQAKTGKPCGTLCMRDAAPEIKGNKIFIHRAERIDEATLLEPEKTALSFQGKKFAGFYGLSVDPSLARSGLGLSILTHCFYKIQSAGFDGVLLETGKDTGWLVAWYERLGCKMIGEGLLHGTDIRTVMMVKWC